MVELTPPRKNWCVMLTLALSALGILYFLGQAFSLGIAWLVTFLDSQSNIPQTISIGLFIWSSILSGLVLVPIFLLSLYHYKNQDVPAWLDTGRPQVRNFVQWIILGWPVIVFIGWLVAGRPTIAAFILGPINLLVAGLPVLWIFNAAQQNFPSGSQFRKWKIFGFSLTLMPVMVIIFEVIAILMLFGVGALWFAIKITTNPQLEQEIMFIINQVSLLGDDLDSIVQFLEPYLLQPLIIFWALAIFGGIMPLIEEIVKPAALWALAGRKLSPQEGFVGGLLCGAGFALIENVLYFTTIITPEDWLFMAIGRAGTGVLHMLASGLVGWGLAEAWRNKKMLFLALTTLGAILLHGLWNSLALVSGVAQIYIVGTEMTFMKTLLFNSPMIILLITAAVVIFRINQHFRNQAQRGSDNASENISKSENPIES